MSRWLRLLALCIFFEGRCRFDIETMLAKEDLVAYGRRMLCRNEVSSLTVGVALGCATCLGLASGCSQGLMGSVDGSKNRDVTTSGTTSAGSGGSGSTGSSGSTSSSG